jgi:hypothetical protein
MRNACAVLLMIVLGGVVCLAQTQRTKERPPQPQNIVPDEKTAIAVAEAVFTPIYGEEQVRNERPFHASLKNGIWTVRGTFNHTGIQVSVGSAPPKEVPIAVGGVATIQIFKSSGCVQSIVHTQ